MKVAVITDTHVGIKNGSDVFLDYAEQFYSEVFFPYCLEHGITRIIHLGDYLDHRKYVNIKVLNRSKRMFLDQLRKHNIRMDIIPGNHDTYYKNTNSLSGLYEVLYIQDGFPVKLHMQPTVINIDGLDIALLPWINPENYNESMEFLKNCKASILGAHLELAGFEMMKGVQAPSHGMDTSPFDRFETVLTGHYHTKSTQGNVNYLGTPLEQTWADCNDPKYFHVLDTQTRDILPVRNPISLFLKLVYDDGVYSDDERLGRVSDIIHNIKKDRITEGKFVRVVVATKKDPILFDRFMDAIASCDPLDVKVIENFDSLQSCNVDDENIEVSDTITLLNSYVEAVETNLDRSRLKSKLSSLFVEAQNLEEVSS